MPAAVVALCSHDGLDGMEEVSLGHVAQWLRELCESVGVSAQQGLISLY